MLLRFFEHVTMEGFSGRLNQIYTLRLHYNTVSAWLPNIFPVYCVKMSADDGGIHNAPSQV